MIDGEGERYVCDWCLAIGATVHVSGPDERPVIVIRDKRWPKHVMQPVKIKERMEWALRKIGSVRAPVNP